jgi:uncharacterized membrane protein (UPF0182 family)
MPTLSLRLAIALGFLILFVGGPSISFYTDWLWFGELGHQQVFTTILRGQASLFTAVFVIAFVWLAFNLQHALSSLREFRPVLTTRDGIEIVLPTRQQMRTIAMALAMVVSIVLALYAAARWEVWLLWRNAVPFGEVDPVLGHDVGFYVFTLPFLRFVRGLAQALVVLALLGSGAAYLLTGSLTAGHSTTISMTLAARRHLAALAAVFLLLLALGAWLQRAEYLVSASEVIYGAGYTDVHARMPVSMLLMFVCVIGAGLAMLHGLTPRNWPIPAAVGLYLATVVGGEIYSSVLQRFVVTPNEQVQETPYILHNIAATRRAFGVDAVEEVQISGDAELTSEDIANNSRTLENVRLWDHQPLLDTFGQLQVIRTYYDFESVDNDRYVIDGTLRQVMLSGRELNSAALPNRTWINERLTFTHGYGLTLGPVNEVTQEGLPVLFVRDLPPRTTVGIDIDEPSIYFGEISNDYVIVNTNNPEFHYPRGDANEVTVYGGTGGVPIGSLLRKLLFAFRFGAYQIVFSDDLTSESRVLFNRRITDRVRTLAPFLAFDRDPYLVVAEGRLFWIYDAYTTSALYPFSTPVGQVNYIRNSVKFVIDAYNGTTTPYLAHPDDPLAQTYARIFPGFFRPIEEMPQALRAHVRYPEDIFAIQASVYRTYHMTQPSVYYNREDQWEIPVIDDQRDAASREMQPYYTIMRLPGEAEPEFIQMLPFTPRQRDNLAAWLVARSDGDNYGRLRVFEFPKQQLVFGPRQVVSRISQDQTIAPQISLWNQQGSQVIWGTLMVIPIEESLIYVRPLYLRAAGGRIPELTRVVVGYGDRIVMEPTLDEGIARLFDMDAPRRGTASPDEQTRGPDAEGAVEPGAPAPDATAVAGLAAQARAHYDRAIQAQRAGDWSTYGEELRRLGDVLARMQAEGRTP